MSKLVIFQRRTGLYPDGILGPITADKLKSTFKIKNDERAAHFIGQLMHETNNFRSSTESLNYSVRGLINTFSYYKRNRHIAELHGRKIGQRANQEAIANVVYSDNNRSKRYKLGNTRKGDGWKFRGRGSIQITGRRNYEAFFKWKGLPKNTDPRLCATLYYWDTAIWYFEVNRIWRLCDEVYFHNVQRVTRAINGGENGLSHRYDLTLMAYRLLKR